MVQPKVAGVTGGARGIGKAICDTFRGRGVSVCTIDLHDNDSYVGDIAEERTLRDFASKVISEHGSSDYLNDQADGVSQRFRVDVRTGNGRMMPG